MFQVVSKGTFLSRAKVRPWSRLYTMNHPTTHTVKKGRFWNSIIPCCSTHRLAVLYSFQCSFHAIIRPSLMFFWPTLASTEQDSGCRFGPLPLSGDGPPFAGHGHTQIATVSNKRCKKTELNKRQPRSKTCFSNSLGLPFLDTRWLGTARTPQGRNRIPPCSSVDRTWEWG